MTAFIPALLVKVTLIFAAGLLVAVAMRRASSSIRHLVLLATLVCGVTLPALMLISPSWKVGVLPQSASGITAATIGGELPLATAVTTSTPTSGGDKNDIARTSPDGVSKRSEEHTSELQSHVNLVCRLLLEKKKKNKQIIINTII